MATDAIQLKVTIYSTWVGTCYPLTTIGVLGFVRLPNGVGLWLEIPRTESCDLKKPIC